MATLTREERETIARRRIVRVLTTHGGVANARTLEQKIGDAGPNPQRIDPHILTPVRNAMVAEGRLVKQMHNGAPWFILDDAIPSVVNRRLAEQLAVHRALNDKQVALRLGQTLEIATYRALLSLTVPFFGRFVDLDDHDDDELYSKEEPPQHLGPRKLAGKTRLDFLVVSSSAIALGIECKNVREWLYPDRKELREHLTKCIALDVIPVLIARRIPFVTFRLLNTCGVILHQVYNQLLAAHDEDVADQARDKKLLGYHDIRTGNEPDARLIKFISTNMLAVASAARDRFDTYKDLLTGYATGQLDYHEFAARVRRRELGQNEDNDWPAPGDPADWDN